MTGAIEALSTIYSAPSLKRLKNCDADPQMVGPMDLGLLHRIPLHRKKDIPITPNGHYTEFGVMDTN